MNVHTTNESSKTVKFSLDTTQIARMDDATRQRMAALADSDIDFSDMPDSAPHQSWVKAASMNIGIRNKKSVTIRLDADVLDFFKSTGAGYQKRINAVLRDYQLAVGKTFTPN